MSGRRDLDLVADVGGTHARFARLDATGAPIGTRTIATAECAGPVEATERYLDLEGIAPRTARAAAFALAGPVTGDRVELTNAGWSFSRRDARERLALDRLIVLNDFEALALALPRLGGEDLETLETGIAAPGEPLALLGPGTGLGVSGLIPAAGGWVALRAEGGHRDLAASSEREWRVVERLAARFGHVSLERALSGPGLAALHDAIRELDGGAHAPADPAEVVAGATGGSCPTCAEACALFSAWLGAAAGDLVLTLGARGGLYLGGGLLGKMDATFDRARFLARFAGKGRFRPYLVAVPVHLIRRCDATLVGAAAALADSARAGLTEGLTGAGERED